MQYNDLTLYRLHIGPHIGQKRLIDITLYELRDIQVNLVEQKKYRTAELVTILLGSIWKHAVKTYRADIRAGLPFFNIAENLEPIKRPAGKTKNGNSTTSPRSEAQVQEFLTVAKARYTKSKKHLLYPYFHTAIAAGLRRGELLGLRRKALINTTVEINGEEIELHKLRITEQLVYYGGKHHLDTPKWESSVRDVPVGPELVSVLKAHMLKVDEVR